jgi:hypothetical protein
MKKHALFILTVFVLYSVSYLMYRKWVTINVLQIVTIPYTSVMKKGGFYLFWPCIFVEQKAMGRKKIFMVNRDNDLEYF